MYVFLVRHGDALTADEDSERPLSEEGREEINSLVTKLSDLPLSVEEIYHSPKMRAVQTAQILAEGLFPGVDPLESDGLLPNDDIDDWAKRLSTHEHNVMLVGHLPFMGLMTHKLLQSEQVSEITFVTGTVIWLERLEEEWKLKDVFHP